MSNSRRDRNVGAGYDYQWEVALYCLLKYVVLRGEAAQPVMIDALRWLGPITEVILEGDQPTNILEDITLLGADQRLLSIQVKESDEDLTEGAWRPSSKGFVKFMSRVARMPIHPNRRVVFLTSGTFHQDVRDLVANDDQLRRYHAARFAGAEDSPDVETSLANWAQVRVSNFISATPVGLEVASDGIGLAIVNALETIGVPSPTNAYQLLSHRVDSWSFKAGGTRLTTNELRSEIMHTLGLTIGSVGSRLVHLVDYLQRVRPDWPSWEQLEQGDVWLDDPEAARLESMLGEHGFALLVGTRGAGKTAMSRIVTHRLVAQNRCPVYWDFEHLGPLPHSTAEVCQHAIATARILGARPLLVLENVHLAPDQFAGILGQLELARAGQQLTVLATARARVDVGESNQVRLEAATLDLSQSAGQRSDGILSWWFSKKLRLDSRALARAYRVVDWSRFRHDLVVLRLALDAFDSASGSITTEKIEQLLERRLERTIRSTSQADEFLYVVSALGQYGLAADFRAVGRMIGMDQHSVRYIAERAVQDGLVSIDDERLSCRFWHDSLAEGYWRVFQTRRLDWADELRSKYRSVR